MTDLYSLLSCKILQPHSSFPSVPTFETQPYHLANVYTENFYTTTALIHSQLPAQSLRSMNLSSKPSASLHLLNHSNTLNSSMNINQQIYRQRNDRPVPQIRVNTDLPTIESAVENRLRLESKNNIQSTQY